jgi:hypothetical protein
MMIIEIGSEGRFTEERYVSSVRIAALQSIIRILGPSGILRPNGEKSRHAEFPVTVQSIKEF